MIIFTAIMGSSRDRLHPAVAPPDPAGRPSRFVCFTDDPGLKADGWEILPPKWRHADPRRTSRWHKFMPHILFPGEPFSLWHDGTNQLTANPWSLVDQFLVGEREIAVCRHPDRSCVYQELEMCIRLHYDTEAIMRKQVDRYREEGYPPRRGLFEMALVLRAHTKQIIEFNEAVWREINVGSVRDQLAVNYVAWKLGLVAAYFPGYRGASPFFKFYPHQKGA